MAIDFSAIAPYPCPRDICIKELLNPSLSARLKISRRGSAPGDSINISGVNGVES
jgi:hypothetical protein